MRTEITTRDIAELTDREQQQLRRYTVGLLERLTASKRCRRIRAEIDMSEQTGDRYES